MPAGDSVQNPSMSSQDQSQDQPSDDAQRQPAAGEPQAAEEQATEEQAAAGAPGPPTPRKGDDGPEEERIAAVSERIDKARSQAEDAGLLVDTDEERYADSGITPSDDDQTIVPPG